MSPQSSIAARYRGPRPWRPTPLAGFSLALHGALAIALVVSPAAWPWIIAVVAANHALLTAAVFMPRTQLLGPNVNRLPEAAARRREVALTFDDGPDPQNTPQILAWLDRHGAKASFFCVGEKAAAHPEIVREIAQRGHSVENHSYRHSNAFACFGIGRTTREVEQELLARLSDRAPGSSARRQASAARCWISCCRAAACATCPGAGAASMPRAAIHGACSRA